MEHRFTGPSYTIGIEEELMIVDAETLELTNSIEGLLDALEDIPKRGRGEARADGVGLRDRHRRPSRTRARPGTSCRSLRRSVQRVAAERGLAIGSAGTHPFAMWEDQRIVSRPRYRDLIAGLQFVARQEIIFGIHVHVGLDDPDKAIHVTNGMRVHLPLLLALSANSPFWRGDKTGLESTRTPIFRAFPRVGIPPRYDDFEDWSKRIDFMTTCKVIRDYTYLWYDVRPHPNFGTVEIRVMDSQTRVEHTLALAALVQAMVKELGEHFDAGKTLSRYPYEMLDENKWLAARHGIEAELVDLPKTGRVPVTELTRRLVERLRPHAEELGSVDDFDCLEDLLENGNGAARQGVVYAGQPRPARGGAGDRRCDGGRARGAGDRGGRRGVASPASPAGYPEGVSQPDLFVVCKNCGSEVSPYVTECPYCGQRVRKRAPKIERGESAEPARRRKPKLPRLRTDEIEGIAPDTRPYATFGLIVVSLLFTLVLSTRELSLTEVGGIAVPLDEDLWRYVVAPFVHDSLGYQFVALVAVAIFGTMLERRFGAVPVVALFLLCGAAGCALAVAVEAPPLLENLPIYPVLGANGAALGLLCAWLVDDRAAARRRDERDNDLLGVYVIAAVLVLLSLAVEEANIAAAAGGAAAGAVLGLALPLFTKR